MLIWRYSSVEAGGNPNPSPNPNPITPTITLILTLTLTLTRRARLEMALRLRPTGGESGRWWAALGATHWAQGQLGHASHATRRALALR